MHTVTNAPESANLSQEDNQIFEAARIAAASLGKTFELWITIARAVELAKHKAHRIGHRNSFERILSQQDIAAVLGNNWNSQKNTASKLLAILARLPEVEQWRATLTAHQRISWSAPTTIFKHCPIFKGDQPERDGGTTDRRPLLTLLAHIRGAIARVPDFMDLAEDEQQAVGEELDELVEKVRECWKEARGGRENHTIIWHKRASTIPGYSEHFGDVDGEAGPDESRYLITPVLSKAGRLLGYDVGTDRWAKRAKTVADAQALAQAHADSNPDDGAGE